MLYTYFSQLYIKKVMLLTYTKVARSCSNGSNVLATLSHLRSKEITGILKLCKPHSNDSSATTEYKPVCIQM